MKVLTFVQSGLRFAVPHARVGRVTAAGEEAAGTSCVELLDGERKVVVWCADPRLVDLDVAEPLTDVLRGAIQATHVVGWSAIEGELVWLVDVRSMRG